MKQLLLWLLVLYIPIQSKQLFVADTQAFLESIQEQNYEHVSLIQEAFFCFDNLDNSKAGFDCYIHSTSIQTLLQVDASQDVILHRAQLLMFAHLYFKLFSLFTLSLHFKLQEGIVAKNYWQQENFEQSLSWRKKSLSSWLHCPSYKKSIISHIKTLIIVEDKIAELLGVICYNKHILSTATGLDNLEQTLLQVIESYHDIFAIKTCEISCQHLSQLYKKIKCVGYTSNMVLKKHKDLYILRYKGTFLSAATLLCVSWVLHQKYKEMVDEVLRKLPIVIDSFVQEHTLDPLHGLKETLWDRKSQRFSKPDFKKFKLEEIKPPDSVWKYLLFYLPEKLCKKVFDTGLHNYNEKMKLIDESVDIINQLLERQWVTIYLAGMGPVFLMMYGTHRLTGYITRESHIKPMRMIIRDIDRLLNTCTSYNDRSFINDGKLMSFVFQFKQYASFLERDELLVMQQDFQDLLSFNLSYLQKQKVVERMYRTYSFLK